MAVPYYNYMLTIYAEREQRKIQRRRIRDVCDPFDLGDVEFQHIFRINKAMGHYLVEQLRRDLDPLTTGNGFPAHIKILCSIQLLANGGYQRQLGQDHVVCAGQTTVSRFVAQFVQSIYLRLLSTWINFPGTEPSRRAVAAGFERSFGLPDVLGVIDCTHVKIFPPKGPQGAQYKNLRKGDHTINVQLVADSECRIIGVNARYPGRVHDAFIWHHSNIKAEMKRLNDSQIRKYFLLGDSGYPLEPWLMTPILNAQPDSPEQRYTDWHCKVRNGIERTNGYLKGSLRCLGIDRVLHYAPDKAAEIIYACCILYNIMKHFGVELELEEQNEPEPEGSVVILPPNRLLREARARRQDIIHTFFA